MTDIAPPIDLTPSEREALFSSLLNPPQPSDAERRAHRKAKHMFNNTEVTAPHDTPEAVEAMAGFFLDRASFGFIYGGTGEPREWNDLMKKRAKETEAMLRRLHQRAVAAERERDELIHDNTTLMDGLNAAETARTTARTDALREFQQGCPFDHPKYSLRPEDPCPVCGDLGTWDDENLAKPSRCIADTTTGET